jgi:gliding motility-associated-like protein
LVILIDDCPSEASETEVIYTNAIDAEAGNDGPFCEGELIQLIGNTNSSGTTIIYQWTGPGGYSSTDQNPSDITQSGDYELLVTIDGCNSELAFTNLIINALPNPTINGLTSACEGEMINLNAGGPYMEYKWSDGSDQQNLDVNTSNTYSVTVTDDNGCTGEDVIDVEIFQNPTANITGSSSYCIGSSTNLALDGAFSQYLWSDNSTDANLVVSNPGLISVTVTDVNNCTAVTSIDITESTSLEPIINGDFSFCPGGSTDLDAGAGFSIYNWSDGTGGQSISVNTPGDYSVTVGDGGGCTGETVVTVSLFTPPTVSISGQQNICENENSMLDAGTGYSSYNWSDGSDSQIFEATTAGTYMVTVTDMNGCTGEDQFEVILNNNPTPIITGNLNICLDEPTDLDAGVGYTQYNWSTGSGQQMLNTNMPGIYSVTVTDGNGCTGETQIEVFQNPSPDAQISGVLEFCAGESVILTGTGGVSYSWTGGVNAPTLNVSNPGTIDLIVTDINGCTDASSVVVMEIQNPEPEIEGLTTLCIGNSIFINTMNTYNQYNWSNGSDQSTIEVFSGGIYRVTVTDGNGCTGETEIEIEEVESLSPQIGGILGFCFGGSTTLEADPGYASYTWSTGQSSQNITVESSGNYSVTVSDTDGCTGETVITVEEFPEITLNLGPDQIIQLGESATVTAIANVDASDIQMVTWEPAEAVECLDQKCIEVRVTSNTLITLQATVSVAEGCIGTDDITIRVEKNQRVYFPTAFSPNEDGINDVFIINAKEGSIANIAQFIVYDRWGEPVHEASNIQPNTENDGWTGFFNNEALNPGVYVYYAIIDFADGDTVVFTGDVTIIK